MCANDGKGKGMRMEYERAGKGKDYSCHTGKRAKEDGMNRQS